MLTDEVAAPGPAPSAYELRCWLRASLAETLGMPAQALAGDVPLSAYGVDSIVAGLLVTSLEDEFGIVLHPEVFEGQPSLDEMAERIAACMG